MSDPPKFMSPSLQPKTDSLRRSNQKKRAVKMEKGTAERYALLGSRRQPGSGSGNRKGDVTTELACMDDKYTDRLSYTIRQADLAKLCSDAEGEGNRLPVLTIRFDKPIEALRFRPKHWVLMPEEAYLEYEILKKNEREQGR